MVSAQSVPGYGVRDGWDVVQSAAPVLRWLLELRNRPTRLSRLKRAERVERLEQAEQLRNRRQNSPQLIAPRSKTYEDISYECYAVVRHIAKMVFPAPCTQVMREH
jgi:hypothetical protein